MTIEDLFVKRYENLERQNTELEKKAKLYEIEKNKKDAIIKKIAKLIQSSNPRISDNGFLSFTIWVSDEVKDNGIKLLKSIGVKVEEN